MQTNKHSRRDASPPSTLVKTWLTSCSQLAASGCSRQIAAKRPKELNLQSQSKSPKPILTVSWRLIWPNKLIAPFQGHPRKNWRKRSNKKSRVGRWLDVRNWASSSATSRNQPKTSSCISHRSSSSSVAPKRYFRVSSSCKTVYCSANIHVPQD